MIMELATIKGGTRF